MGVDYLKCQDCHRIFPDCSDYDHCYACEESLCIACSEKALETAKVCKKCNHVFGECSCKSLNQCECKTSITLVFCQECTQPSRPSQSDLITYLLQQLNLSLDQAEIACLNSMGLKPTRCVFVREGDSYGINQI